jgi:hypothetical protein
MYPKEMEYCHIEIRKHLGKSKYVVDRLQMELDKQNGTDHASRESTKAKPRKKSRVPTNKNEQIVPG